MNNHPTQPPAPAFDCEAAKRALSLLKDALDSRWSVYTWVSVRRNDISTACSLLTAATEEIEAIGKILPQDWFPSLTLPQRVQQLADSRSCISEERDQLRERVRELEGKRGHAEVRRFGLDEDGDAGIVPDPNGGFVAIEDFEKLLTRVCELEGSAHGER